MSSDILAEGPATPAIRSAWPLPEPSDRIRRLVVWLLVATYSAFFSSFTIERHEAWDSGAFDLGFMDQAAWNTVRGNIMGVTIEPWQALTHLGYHFDPILIPVSLTYLLYSSPHSLLIVQSVGIALGALPLSWLARRWLGSNVAAIAFAGAYLLYPGLQAANVYDFHGFTLSAPLLVWCFWLVETRQLRWLALALVLTMATKENVPLTTAMLGLYMAFVRRMWVAGAVATVASIAWFLIGTYVVIPAFNVEGQGWLWNRYGGMGGTPLQIVGFLLENPRRLIEPGPGLNNLSYVAKLLFPLGFLSLLDPFALAVALPALATNVLTVYEPMHMLETYHYTATLVAVVTVSAIGGTRRIAMWARWIADRARLSGDRWSGLATAACVALVLATSLVYQYYRGYTPISPAFAWPRVTEHHAIGREVAATIPSDGVVSAQSSVYPHVSQRSQIWMYPYVGPAEYIFLDVASQPNMVGLNEGFHGVLRETLAQPDFGWVTARDGYVVLRRGAPHRDLPDEFYSFARSADPKPEVPMRIDFGDSVRLIGFDYQTHRDATVDLNLYWQALRPLSDDLFMPIYLTDRQGHELGATNQPQPANYWYPTSRWRVGETIHVQTVNLPFLAGGRSFGLAVGVTAGTDPWDVGKRLMPRLATAPWRTPSLSQGTLVEIISFDNDRGLLHPSTLPRATPAAPEHSVDVTVGTSIRLAGYDLPSEARAGGQATITLYWQGTGPDAGTHTVFVHLLDGDGKLVAQQDSMPLGGQAATNTWLPGDNYADRYVLSLPASLAPGDYRVVVGMYAPSTGVRLRTSGQWSTGDAVALPVPVRVQ